MHRYSTGSLTPSLDRRRRLPTWAAWSLVALLGLQLLDVLTTSLGLQRGGVEAMEPSRLLLGVGGVPLLALVKLVLVAVLAALLWLSSRWWGEDARGRGAALIVLAGAQLGIFALLIATIWNVGLLLTI